MKKYYPNSQRQQIKADDIVSLEIYESEAQVIDRDSGCGKTTCGKTCLGMYPVTDGEVLFHGKTIHTMSMKERFAFTKRVQMIFQDPYASLDPHQKVYDIIAEGIQIHGMAKNKTEEKKMVAELLEMVGLNAEHAARNVHEISGGQRQRIGIARALSVSPEFLFCDEPISALDVSIQAQIINLLMKLQKEKKSGIYIACIAYLGISLLLNLYTMTLILAGYLCVRYVCREENRSYKGFCVSLIRPILAYIKGLALAAVLLIPKIYLSMTSGRVGSADLGSLWYYEKRYYADLLTGITGNNEIGIHGFVGVSILALLAV